MEKVELIATTTFGLEGVVKEEVKELGFEDIEVEDGKVSFTGDLSAICEANLWLRSAERVRLKLGEFEATDFDELYEKTKALPWAEWLPKEAEFPVQGKSISSELHSVPTCQSIVKKAIVDNMQEKYNIEWFNEEGPLYPIEVALKKDIATLTIDTSGSGLHKRGYRELSTPAPLQETIAAGMIYLSLWEPDRVLIDPFCGSGTIPIEAAMLGKNIAPGLQRSFAAEKWVNISDSLWKEARQKAQAAIKDELEPRLIMGTDIDSEMFSIARHHARKAGVEGWIHFQTKPFAQFSTNREYGYIITNPPYGERLTPQAEVEELYRLMGDKFRPLDTWSIYVLTSHQNFEKLYGKKASKRRKLYNGGIECQYYQYYGPWPSKS
ncbi:THUMP domain-containing class I SAM-dependent RNA methyltransferase [Fuchsiella alkaliacetigena]|uniref:THUMP domain-containing class I SAM-dependent RNA methyltransferase n=1 Tax=Fuchsiella alkaliacetigena TaxID=957042 RepID=UPI00200A7C2B|nr:class I SAM-dependent RNA methyltransferase [Fuchsiella alkaliacetigena]MCK8825799.1 class I SAM-dependent RNA methyltransferase [Fuchsiella alkaliacetigena]